MLTGTVKLYFWTTRNLLKEKKITEALAHAILIHKLKAYVNMDFSTPFLCS